jgi:methylmalonyl-CoA mutase
MSILNTCMILKKKGAGHIKIFGGGGGVILPSEIAELQG